MRRYIARRLLLAIPVLVGVTFGTFVLIRVVPGDIIDLKCGNQCTEEDRAELRKALDLDRPIAVQYLAWLSDAIRGDFGRSLQTSQPVSDALTRRLPVTIELAALAMLFAVVLALPVAVIAAVFQDRPPDYVLRFLSILGLGIPNFWIASMAVTLPAIWWAWVPPTGHTPFFSDPADNLRKLFIPAFILSLSVSALIMRLLRSSLLEVLRQDYVRTARAKGLGGTRVIMRHAMRNALVPVVTVVGIQFGFLLGGTVIIEQIFVIPGIGTSTLSSIVQRDYPQLQANVLVLAAMFVAANLAVDVLYAAEDPLQGTRTGRALRSSPPSCVFDALDVPARQAIVGDIQRLLLDEVPVAYLIAPDQFFGAQAWLKNYRPMILNNVEVFRRQDEWWLDGAPSRV